MTCDGSSAVGESNSSSATVADENSEKLTPPEATVMPSG
jgi:hypothetical protein